MQNELAIGISAYPASSAKVLAGLGVGWVRQGFGYPFEDRMDGPVNDYFKKTLTQAQQWREQGFKVMGHTPLLGSGTRLPDEQGQLQFVWNGRTPGYMGELGTAAFHDNYRKVSEFLARELAGIVDAWQIGNEFDLPIFAGPLNPKQACDLIVAGAQGLREADAPNIGTNHTGYRTHYFMLGHLYHLYPDLFDYCGVDAYFGTWETGSPDDWASRIAELYELTGKRVLVNEWGYSSAGGLMSEQDRANEVWPCQVKAWRFAWDQGHTWDVQAKYVKHAFEAFAKQRDKLAGAFFYRLEDQPKCWHCGQTDCPAEMAWGLVDMEGKTKPAYQAFREGVDSLP